MSNIAEIKDISGGATANFSTRKLATKDVFSAVRILNIIGISDEINNFISMDKTKANQEKVGASFINVLLKGLSNEKAEKLIYDLLADIARLKSGTDVANMEIECLITLLKQIAGENNISGFFNNALSLANIKK